MGEPLRPVPARAHGVCVSSHSCAARAASPARVPGVRAMGENEAEGEADGRGDWGQASRGLGSGLRT